MTGEEQPNWAQIVNRHGKRVFRIANRILGSVHDAEDVSQEVFTEAYRMHQAGPVQSWTGLLVRLATLRAIDRLRGTRLAKELHDNDHVSTIEPFDELTARELAQWLRAAIARLPDQQATVFALVHFEHLSRDEVASSLDISPESVSTALYKARQRLILQISVLNEGNSQ
ncbi:ECF RNA polymerase sigma factor SigE [Gimesia panareensis]|uniref:ECF RNA polymerase sigma factor SigE n=1 Tax=Gimesia panareensis TaxID=2527978 RepID=A0A517Q001_9PLAN|nr:sigma-70 family RNA polymerase sigma factor [Gimesia panareensis]QDT24953.1 ECF RNA polymerase sigma factor SigE [Gimesia panareensis]